MRRTSVIATTVLITALLPAVPAVADPGDPELRPVDGALVSGTEPAQAESTTSEVTDLTLDGASREARPAFSGEPFTFVFEGNGLNARYVNGVDVGGHRVYTLDDLNGFTTHELALEAQWLSPGENEITLFTGTRPGTCNMDDFDVRNVRLRTPGGTEILDPAHPSAEEVTLGDGTCGSNETRPREITYTFTIPDDAGTGPLGRVSEVDATTLDNGPHQLEAATAGGEATANTIWTDTTLTDPAEVGALLPAGTRRPSNWSRPRACCLRSLRTSPSLRSPTVGGLPGWPYRRPAGRSAVPGDGGPHRPVRRRRARGVRLPGRSGDGGGRGFAAAGVP